MVEFDKYPLDFAALTRGDVLEIATLERVFGVEYVPGADIWKFALMGLQEQIHHKTELTCVTERDRIRVLTDAEASATNAQRIAAHRAGIFRRNVKLMQVDRGALDGDQLQEHDRRLRSASAACAALLSAKHEVTGGERIALPSRLPRIETV
jgi:hypothetical protein